MPHKRDIHHYEGQLGPLAEAIGCLTYDQLSAFLGYLAEELANQSEADAGRGRPRLSHELEEAAMILQAAIPHIERSMANLRSTYDAF